MPIWHSIFFIYENAVQMKSLMMSYGSIESPDSTLVLNQLYIFPLIIGYIMAFENGDFKSPIKECHIFELDLQI